MLGTVEAQFFPGPRCEDNVPFEFDPAIAFLSRDVLGDFQHSGDSGGVVVSADVDLPPLLVACQRSAGACSEVVDVGADKYRVG